MITKGRIYWSLTCCCRLPPHRVALMFFESIFVLSALALAAPRPQDKARAEETVLSICDLARSSKAYDGKLVRVRGMAVSTFEERQLIDPSCAPMRSALGFDSLSKNEVSMTFEHTMEKCQAAEVVVRGIFHGSDRLLKQGREYQLHRSKTGYGYLRSSPMQIDVHEVEKAGSASLPGFQQCSVP